MPDCWFSILLDINLWLFWPRSDLAKSYSTRGRSPRFWFVVLPDVPDHPCEHVLVPVDHIGHTVLVKADLLCILRVQEKNSHVSQSWTPAATHHHAWTQLSSIHSAGFPQAKRLPCCMPRRLFLLSCWPEGGRTAAPNFYLH